MVKTVEYPKAYEEGQLRIARPQAAYTATEVTFLNRCDKFYGTATSYPALSGSGHESSADQAVRWINGEPRPSTPMSLDEKLVNGIKRIGTGSALVDQKERFELGLRHNDSDTAMKALVAIHAIGPAKHEVEELILAGLNSELMRFQIQALIKRLPGELPQAVHERLKGIVADQEAPELLREGIAAFLDDAKLPTIPGRP